MSTHTPSPSWFRYVMGQVPTPVALLTAEHPDAGPVGMVVGSLVSVSLDPPLVGVLIDERSSTWPLIREVGAWTVSVLAADATAVCDAFARKRPDRFELLRRDPTSHGGWVAAESVATIDCTLSTTTPAGDHTFVLGHVDRMEPTAPRADPLLFVRGGFAAPATAELAVEQHPVAVQLERSATIAATVADLARALERPCIVSTASHGTVSVLASYPAGPAHDVSVGSAFPLAAPYAPLFAAWGSEADQQLWSRRADDLLTMLAAGPVAVPGVAPEKAPMPASHRAILDGVRERGYAITHQGSLGADLMRVVAGPATAECVREAALLAARLADSDAEQHDLSTAAEIHLPVRVDGEVVLALTVAALDGTDVRRVLGAADAAAKRCEDLLCA